MKKMLETGGTTFLTGNSSINKFLGSWLAFYYERGDTGCKALKKWF